MRTYWPKLALLVGSILVTLGVLEIVFRIGAVSSPELSAEAIWSAQKPSDDRPPIQRLRIGKLEFRESQIPASAKGTNTRRLLMLGDSFTAGYGIALNSDRFSDLIESELNRELAASGSSRRIHVFNAGKGATFPHQWVHYYETLGPLYRPDAVIAVFFLRDGTPLNTSLMLNRAIIDPIRERYQRRPLYEWSAALRFVYNRLAWREYTQDFKRRLVAAYVGSREQQVTWRKQRTALFEIAKDCRRKGIPFHLVIFPLLFQLDDYAFFEVEEVISDFARRHDIPVFSLTPGFLGEKDHTLWVGSNDQHPNEKGHRIAARTLLPYVREVLLTDANRELQGPSHNGR